MLNNLLKYFSVPLVILFSLPVTAQALFDSHLHYSAEDATHFTPQQIINFLDNNNIAYAAVTSTPAKNINQLYQLAPDRIIPILGLYRHSSDKTSWTKDRTLIPHLEKELKRGHWRGIGELHIFAQDRHNKIFNEIITLATKWQLPLLIHGDPAVIDKLYEIAPEQPVIWAHAGTYPYPDLLSDYLRRYPNLSIDVSMRDERIAPGGKIADDWYELFVTYPSRFMIGVDTYSSARWQLYNNAVKTIRHWLTQLPSEIAQQLAFINAAKLYKKTFILNNIKEN